MKVFIVLLWLSFATLSMSNNNEKTDRHQRRYFVKKKYRPKYHISAPGGMLTTPTGLAYFKMQYHVFYQYHPITGSSSNSCWGHSVSDNLIDWVRYPPAIIPKEYYDMHGCGSGSTQIFNNYLYLFYTGQVLFSNQSLQTQNLALSSNGITFRKYLYNPVIHGSPAGIRIKELRNPKVWKFRNLWYMIIASMSIENKGQLLLYTSRNLLQWRFNGTLAESFGDMGYLWENPELFEIMGYHVLIFSAQGVQTDGHRYRNLHQTGYVIGRFNYIRAQFDDVEISTSTFHELDYGHDFYGAKTLLAPDGRILLIAWLGMWESEFKEASAGWAGMLTLIREVTITNQGRLLMSPVKEITGLRKEILEKAWYSPGETFPSEAKSFELLVNTTTVFADVIIQFNWTGGRYTIKYFSEYGQVIVDRGGEDGIRKAYWSPKNHLYFQIFVDSSSVEVFCGEGEVVFSSRIYPKAMEIKIEGQAEVYITQYKLRRSVIFVNNLVKGGKGTDYRGPINSE